MSARVLANSTARLIKVLLVQSALCDEETETQRQAGTCSRSHSKEVIGPALESRFFISWPLEFSQLDVRG